MFQITDQPIDPTALKKDLENNAAGALNVFEGWVRNRNEGHAVNALEYEAYPELCSIEMEKIVSEAQTKYKVLGVHCVHRVGLLELGELAVWLGVTSVHREDAFAACRFIIDELKVRLPIWKKEHYVDKDSEWVNCQTCSHHHHKKNSLKELETHFFLRQKSLGEFGEEGMRKLAAAKVLVVGAGALGTSALESLATSGVGEICICDGDRIEATNLHRQFLYGANDIGQFKVDVALNSLREKYPFLKIKGVKEFATEENVEHIFGDFQYILDCTDSIETKFLLHDFCKLNGKILIQSSVYQYEGQIQIFRPEDKSCLRCLYPQAPSNEEVATCAESGTLGPVAGVFGHLQTNYLIKEIVGLPVQSGTWIFNSLTMDSHRIEFPINSECPLCCSGDVIESSKSQQQQKQEALESLIILANQINSNFSCIDLRDDRSTPLNREFKKITESSVADLWTHSKDIIMDEPTVLICDKGIKSTQVGAHLRETGFTNLYSLKGGAGQLQ